MELGASVSTTGATVVTISWDNDATVCVKGD
jgi:hypothetical protein